MAAGATATSTPDSSHTDSSQTDSSQTDVSQPGAFQQGSLFGGGDPSFPPRLPGHRVALADGAWYEHVPGWMRGDQTLADHLIATTTWQAQRRPMYDRIVDVPRLTAVLPRDGDGHPVLLEIAAFLTATYHEPFDRISLAHYRDGRDSVAPHGDQVARTMQTTTMATVSCGEPRRFHLGRVDGPGSASLVLGHGDLLVMGGTIQPELADA